MKKSVFALVFLGLAASAVAQYSDALGVAVKIHAKAYVWYGEGEGPGVLEVSGDFLSGTHVSSAMGAPESEVAVELRQSVSQPYVRVEPSKPYTLTVTGTFTYTGAVTISPPAGYTVVIENEKRRRVSFDGGTTVVFSLEPDIYRRHGLAGTMSSVDSNSVDLKISLGEGRWGKSLGDISLVNTGMGSDWRVMVQPGALTYEASSGDVEVTYSNGGVSRVIAPQVIVDVTYAAWGSYGPMTIRVYHPSQMTKPPPTYQPVFGTPHVVYDVSTFDSNGEKVLKVIRTTRYTTTTSINAYINQIEYFYLRRSGAWPNHTWVKTAWSTSEDWTAAPSEVVTVSAAGATTRTETISVRVPTAGAVPNSSVFSLSRVYSRPKDALGYETIGEALQTETRGTSNSSVTSFQYNTDASGYGGCGNVEAAMLPGGSWVAYVYYNCETAGQVAYRYRPSVTGPVSPPTSLYPPPTTGEVAFYTYQNDLFGAFTRLTLMQTKVNNVETSKTTLSYVEDQGMSDGAPYYTTKTTRTDYSSAGASLTSVSLCVQEDYYLDPSLSRLPLSETGPDGVRRSYVYQFGTWTGATFVEGQPASAYRVGIVTGSTNASAGTLCSTVGTQWYSSLVPLYLIDGQSTWETTVRNGQAQVVCREKYVWKSGAWRRVDYTIYSYDLANRLVGTTRNGNSIRDVSYGYTTFGGQKYMETGEDGVATTFFYDAGGRLSYSIRAASANVPELKTSYTYDAMGQLLSEKVGPDNGEQIQTTRSYDDAGRLSSETLPGIGASTHSYSYFAPSAGNSYTGYSHTVARAKPFGSFPDSNGGTIVETSYLDGRLFSKTGTAIVPEFHSYGVEADGRTWEQVFVAPSSSQPLSGARWTKTWKDWLGRSIRNERPGFSGGANIVEESFHNSTAGQFSTGHVYMSTKPAPNAGGLLSSRTEYNALGKAFRSGLDVSGDGLVLASDDRIKDETEGLEIEAGTGHLWWRTESLTYPYSNSSPPPGKSGATAVVLSTTRVRLTGFSTNQVMETKTTDGDGNITTQSKFVDRGTKVTTVTTSRTGVGNAQVEKYENGLGVEVIGFDGVRVQTVYDSLHRVWKKVDQRNNNTSESLYATGTRMVASVKEKAQTSSPITTVQYGYDSLGRKTSAIDADGKATYFSYNRRDQVIRQWGSASYPVAFAYNGFGEKVAMRTFRNPSQDFTGSTWPLADDGSDAYNPDSNNWTSGDKTVWNFDASTGLLSSKVDATNKNVSYGYGRDLQMTSREWARVVTSGSDTGQRVKATYGYSASTGEQTGISYNDGTPAVSYAYTRLGQLDSVSDAATGTRDLVYDPDFPRRLYSEALDTFYGQKVVTRQYEASGVVGRIRGFKVGASVGSNSDLEQTYGYSSTTGRFDTLMSGRSGNAATRTFHYGYESNSSLVKTLWTDDNNFYVTRTFEDNRDVLTSVETKWGQGASSAITKYAYSVNALGQRANVEQSGDAFSGYYSTSTIHQTFTYNPRGELTGAPTRLGTVSSPGATIANRQHEFDYDLIGNRKWAGLTGNTGDRKNYSANSLNQYASRDNSSSPFSGSQSFTYDDDGNLLTDGQWNYTWDAENRLVRMSSSLPAGQGYTRLELNFKYDYLGRRVEKKVENLDGPTPNYTQRFLYDGWNLVAEYSYASSSLTLVRSYTWGLDIARTLLDAGGVGALVQIADHGTGATYHPSYDGNGNIATLVSGSSGTVAAVYEYSPYGEAIRAAGTYAAANPFRFSTKFTDDETGLVYYGRRYYCPGQGRFLGRDTIEERGGRNLYAFCRNNAIDRWDILGMWPEGLVGDSYQPPPAVSLPPLNPTVSNVIGLVSGSGQAVAGLGIATTTGISGVGFYGGIYLFLNGASTFVASAGNLIDTANGGSGQVLNNSGFLGLATSGVSALSGTPTSSTIYNLATCVDILGNVTFGGITGLGSGFAGTAQLRAFQNLPGATIEHLPLVTAGANTAWVSFDFAVANTNAFSIAGLIVRPAQISNSTSAVSAAASVLSLDIGSASTSTASTSPSVSGNSSISLAAFSQLTNDSFSQGTYSVVFSNTSVAALSPVAMSDIARVEVYADGSVRIVFKSKDDDDKSAEKQ